MQFIRYIGYMLKEMRLLGEVQVLDGHHEYSPAVDRRLALLGYLACQGGAWLERDKLAFLFWPDARNEQARTNLRGLLARCRKLPYASDLESQSSRLRWPVVCDASEFRRAVENDDWQEATALYRGEFFAGANFDGMGEFTSWVEMERAELKESWRTVVFRQAKQLEDGGRLGEAVGLLEEVLGKDPLDEEALQLVMRLLARSGRPEQALGRCRNFRRALRESLDLQPTSVTERLERAIQQQLNDSAEQQVAVTEPAGVTRVEPVENDLPVRSAAGGRPATKRRPSDLPLTSFVGRELELGELLQLIGKPDRRLVTLLGPGGVGKTRLALQAIEHLDQRYPDGAHFVPLDVAVTARSVPLSIASSLGIVLHGTADPLDQVVRSLAGARILLVLDNFEQLSDGASIISALLTACPRVDLLVTSRERLGLAEEWLLPLQGLAYPTSEVEPEEALRFDAIRFFSERARQVRTDFTVGEEELAHLLDICRTVDGLPLGLELAAVWIRIMPVAEIALEVRRNLDFLSAGSRNVAERHRSIRSAFEHSWGLLSQRERVVLRKLTALRGGFRREAAAYVAGASIPVLAALVDKSLLSVSSQGRYDWHPLLYQFCAEKLAEHPDEKQEARNRHASYFASMSEEAGQNDYTPQQETWLRRIESEYDNFRAALDWAEASEQAELGLRLVGSLNWYWGWRGIVAEPREWLSRMLAIPPARKTSARAKALRGAGLKATLQGDLELGRQYAQEALAIARELGDWKTEFTALLELADASFFRGDYDSAEALQREALALAREYDDQADISIALAELGVLFLAQGQLDEAESMLTKSAALSRELGNKVGVAVQQAYLGRVALAKGENERGKSLLEESVATARELRHVLVLAIGLLSLGSLARDQGEYDQARGNLLEGLGFWWEARMTWRVGQSLEAIAALCTVTGDPERAALLWGAAEANRESRSTELPPMEQQSHERFVEMARRTLDPEVFEAAWARGRATILEDAVALAVETLDRD